VFFVFVSYAHVIGYGHDQIAALGNASAPLNDLAIEYASKDFATMIDLVAGFSAFVIGSLSATARLLVALGRAGLASRIGELDAARGTPAAAILVAGALWLFGILVWAPFVGAADYFGYLDTIGTLALILVYGSVTAAQLAESLNSRRVSSALSGFAGLLTLIWPLYNSAQAVTLGARRRHWRRPSLKKTSARCACGIPLALSPARSASTGNFPAILVAAKALQAVGDLRRCRRGAC
jgi:hypothetical protein